MRVDGMANSLTAEQVKKMKDLLKKHRDNAGKKQKKKKPKG